MTVAPTISLASGLSEKSDKVQAATLLHVAGIKALELFNTFTWEREGDDDKVDKILENRSFSFTVSHIRISRGTTMSSTHEISRWTK